MCMDPIALLFLLPLLLGRRGGGGSKRFNKERYKPGSLEQIELFEAAAEHLGVPRSWAKSDSLQTLLWKESNGGWVGIPNYEYKSDRWGANVSNPDNRGDWPGLWAHLRAGGEPPKGRGATGLGQMILTNIPRHYPDGFQGIGDPWNEAVGMLSYINARWKSPDRAWECYKAGVCTSGVGIDGYGGPKNWSGY